VRAGEHGGTETGAFQVPEVTGRSVAGLVLFDSGGDWDAAAETYERSLVAFESLLDAQLTAQGRRRTLERSPRLSRWAAYALARAGRHEQAVQAIEQGRARELTLSASRGTVELDALRQVDPALAARYELDTGGTALAEAATTAYRAVLVNTTDPAPADSAPRPRAPLTPAARPHLHQPAHRPQPGTGITP